MKYLASAAMALALAAVAASAHADQPNNDQTTQTGGHHGGDGAGSHGGQSGRSAGAAATSQGAATTQGAASGQVHTFNGGVHTFNGGVHSQGSVGQQGYSHGYSRGPGAVVQGVAVPNGSVTHTDRAGGSDQWGGNHDRGDWNGDRGGSDRNGRGFVAGIQVGPGGHHDHGFAGAPGADRQMRDRDQGRGWFQSGQFPRQSFAQQRFHDRDDRYPGGWYARTWSFGEFLPFGWFAPDYYLDWGDYGLPAPPIGCEWVREGGDAVLVNVWTGEILSVWRGLFW